MRFWDSSAIVPLVLNEATSAACRAEQRVDPSLLVCRLTRAEVESAIRRQQRDGLRRADELRFAERKLATLASQWRVVELSEDVETDAVALIGRHPLRAADAFQLAAARATTNGRPRGHVFVTRDEVLAKAARKEGFRVIVPRA
jgi:predicted nucleic acid-binding protein